MDILSSISWLSLNVYSTFSYRYLIFVFFKGFLPWGLVLHKQFFSPSAAPWRWQYSDASRDWASFQTSPEPRSCKAVQGYALPHSGNSDSSIEVAVSTCSVKFCQLWELDLVSSGVFHHTESFHSEELESPVWFGASLSLFYCRETPVPMIEGPK